MSWIRQLPVVVSVLLFAAASACQRLPATAPQGVGVPRFAVVPPQGDPTTLDIGSWNIEWFGDVNRGPTDEPLQLQNVRDVVAGADLDIWGFEEVVSPSQWNSLESQLPGYTGFLANEPNVTNGAAFYTAAEQKVGILYRSSIATLLGAQVILTGNDFDFAGRPPLEVKLRVTLNGTTEDIVVIVLHMKAFNDQASWQRRQNASTALKTYLDTTYPTQKVFVIGDFNDDVDVSITTGQPSPYANFVNDVARYRFPTKELSDAGIATTTGFPDAVDHHLNTNEINPSYVANSAEAFRADQFVPNYATTTSDHFPVLTRYTFGAGGATPAVTVTVPNGGESWAGGSAQTITWTSTAVTNVKLEYTLDGGTNWTLITASTAAASGSFAWTLPNSASTNALVRISDTGSATSDVSNGAFTITVAGGSPQVIINEILANEPGASTAGEFVEIVNIGGAAANIGGWTVSDGTAVRHTFAAGTTLAAGKAIVVFGGASAIPPGLTNAVAASTGALSFNNAGDLVRLQDAAAGLVQEFQYGSALAGTDGVSMNRNPDTSAAGPFVLHTTLSTLQASAGKRVSGADF